MKYSILLYITTALAFRITNCGLIYSTNNLQYPNLTPYAFRYSYLNSPSYLIPYTYTTSDQIIKEYIVKHHHPDHHGTDNNWKPPQSSSSQSQTTPLSNKPENDDGNKLPLIRIQSVLDSDANIPTNQVNYIPLSSSAPITYTTPTPLTWPTSIQFHQQDNIGQYYYGYANPISSKKEIKTADGITRGAYSYIDANGKLQNVQYISDDINGFRVAATNLPKAPIIINNIPDSPDIIKAKEEFFQAQQDALDFLNAVNNNKNNNNTNDDNISENHDENNK